MWSAIDYAVLCKLLAYLDEDDIYGFWVFAEETRLDHVCNYITSDFGEGLLSQTRARHVAMGFSCWTAVLRLTKTPLSPRLSRRTLEYVTYEIQRRVGASGAHHPDRQTAMMTAALPGSIPPFVMYFAAEQGNLESVIWLHSVARYDPPEALRVAARHGHDHVITWLLDNVQTARWLLEDCVVKPVFRYEEDPGLGVLAWCVTYEDESHVSAFSRKWGFADAWLWGYGELQPLDLPVRHGDFESMKRMVACGFRNEHPKETAKHAARAGHLPIVEWLYTRHQRVFDDSGVFAEAAGHGHLEVSRWIAAHARPCAYGLRRACYGVVSNGHTHVLRWLAETFPETAKILVDNRFSVAACERGQLAVMQWFVEEQGMEIKRFHFACAAKGGHIHVFQWLLANRKPDSEWVEPWLSDAAESGDLEFVRWLVEDCGLWSPSACAASTSIEVAEYLHSFALLQAKPQHELCGERQGKPLIRDGLFEALIWLLEHGMTEDYFEEKMFDKINDFETNFAKKQQQLGWNGCSRSDHEYWPRNPSNMKRLRKVVQVVIDVYDPEFLCEVLWLPKWTVRHGTVKNLERLAAIGHPKLLSTKIFRMLLRVSRDADKVQWFLIKEPSLFSTNVVRWAVQYDKRHLLSWIFREVLATTDSDFEVLKFRCVKTAQWFARKYGRPEIDAWVLNQ